MCELFLKGESIRRLFFSFFGSVCVRIRIGPGISSVIDDDVLSLRENRLNDRKRHEINLFLPRGSQKGQFEGTDGDILFTKALFRTQLWLTL